MTEKRKDFILLIILILAILAVAYAISMYIHWIFGVIICLAGIYLIVKNTDSPARNGE